MGEQASKKGDTRRSRCLVLPVKRSVVLKLVQTSGQKADKGDVVLPHTHGDGWGDELLCGFSRMTGGRSSITAKLTAARKRQSRAHTWVYGMFEKHTNHAGNILMFNRCAPSNWRNRYHQSRPPFLS